ncbi:MAG: PrsW family intramembrane metalloprotease [Planctomycetaceae bacterium]|nr:PrsW family intramembrane metalloprotease [Planctomycetaceae bacterium]
MPIKFSCPECHKSLKVEERLVGKRTHCPGCQAAITIPSAESVAAKVSAPKRPVEPEPKVESGESESESYGLAKPTKSAASDDEYRPRLSPPKKVAAIPTRSVKLPARPPVSDSGGSRSHWHWLLALALVPLALSMFWKDEATFTERLTKTVAAHPEIEPQLEQLPPTADLEALFNVLPGHKLEGAHLSRHSWIHWLYALLSIAGFLALLTMLFPDGSVSLKRLLVTGLVTGTLGILLLLAFQWVAAFTQGFNVRGRSIVVVFFYIVKFIGFSYRCALEEGNGFGLSFMGFTFGVGLCEEICKALPIAIYLRSVSDANWKGACLVGLASGIGFGVSEGITYSTDYYNGISGVSIYLVRFVSCVALHALWSGCVAQLMYHNQDHLSDFDWESALGFIAYYLSIAMVLHGLYDTLLKQEYHLWALGIAVASFGWFVVMVSRQDDEE